MTFLRSFVIAVTTATASLLLFSKAAKGTETTNINWTLPTCNNTPSDCYTLAEQLQVTGTEESIVQSTAILTESLSKWDDDASLWSSFGKLNLFYNLNWNLAQQSIGTSLMLDHSVENLNTYLFGGWLYSTPQYFNIPTAANYFETAINLVSSPDDDASYNTSSTIINFWPYFEYGVFLSHIAQDYSRSQKMFEVAVSASSINNPFIAFFYGLLLEYHSDEIDVNMNETMNARNSGGDSSAEPLLDGQLLIQSAISIAETAPDALPGQAAWNMIFQAILLQSMGRLEEAQHCCDFSAAILDPKLTNWYVFCPSINDNVAMMISSEDKNDGDGYDVDSLNDISGTERTIRIWSTLYWLFSVAWILTV